MDRLASLAQTLQRTAWGLAALIVNSCAVAESKNEEKEALNACERLPRHTAALCRDALAHRFKGRLGKVAVSDAAEYGKKVASQVVRLTSMPRVLCKARLNGTIHCVPFAQMVAWTNVRTIEHLVDDVNRLGAIIRADDETWFKCESGKWGSLRDASQMRIGNWLRGSAAKAMKAHCDDPATRGSGGGEGGPGGSSSRITGIDMSQSFCALGLDLTSSSDKLMKEAEARLSEMQKQCTDSLLSKFARAEGESADSSTPTTTEATVEIKDNGDGTETVTEKDADGNVVEQYTRDRTNTYDTLTIEYRNDGSTVKTGTRDPPAADADVDPTTSSPLWIQTVVNANGDNWTVEVMPDGSARESGRDSKKGVGATIYRNRPLLCADEGCAACSSFAKFNPKVKAACKAGGSLCKNFLQASSCCQAPGGLFNNPTVVIPNPEGGDLTCTNSSDTLQDKRCKYVCQGSPAQADCGETCKVTPPTPFEMTLLDRICIYAHSEDCFSNSVPSGAPSIVPIVKEDPGSCMTISCPPPQ